MAVLDWYPNRNFEGDVTELILTVSGTVVGTITIAPGGTYSVSTKGHVPAIDGFSGTSFNDVWAKIAARIRTGGVYSMRLITGVRDAESPSN